MSDASKSGGQFQKAQGSLEETIGNVTGATSWQQSGREKQAVGEGETKTAQAKGYVEGTKDRVTGKADQLLGSAKGDTSEEISGKVRNEKGSAQQDVNE